MTKKIKDAIKASILHWQKDIVARLKQGDKISKVNKELLWQDGTEVSCTMYHCALCMVVKPAGYNDACKNKCPLKSCSPGSTWDMFYLHPTLKNAQRMVNKLKGLLTPKPK
jgi:hypothetical protein